MLALYHVQGMGKHERCIAIFMPRGASTHVIEMEVGKQDVGYFRRIHPERRQLLQEASLGKRNSVAVYKSRIFLVTRSCIDQDAMMFVSQ
jgi:hypothetical protein